jgi:hypothetical protein
MKKKMKQKIPLHCPFKSQKTGFSVWGPKKGAYKCFEGFIISKNL